MRPEQEMLLVGFVLPCLVFLLIVVTANNIITRHPSTDVAKVVTIIDGDTLDLVLDGQEIRVRLLGIDTPERGQPLYLEAKERLQELAGESVYVEADGASQDRYGRYLFWVWSENGQLINGVLVDEGLADCYYRPSFGGRKYATDLLRFAADACANKLGIWSDDYGRKTASVASRVTTDWRFLLY